MFLGWNVLNILRGQVNLRQAIEKERDSEEVKEDTSSLVLFNEWNCEF